MVILNAVNDDTWPNGALVAAKLAPRAKASRNVVVLEISLQVAKILGIAACKARTPKTDHYIDRFGFVGHVCSLVQHVSIFTPGCNCLSLGQQGHDGDAEGAVTNLLFKPEGNWHRQPPVSSQVYCVLRQYSQIQRAVLR